MVSPDPQTIILTVPLRNHTPAAVSFCCRIQESTELDRLGESDLRNSASGLALSPSQLRVSSWAPLSMAFQRSQSRSVLPTIWIVFLSLGTSSATWAQNSVDSQGSTPPPVEGRIRIATFNVSMNRSSPEGLLDDLKKGDSQIRKVASIIRLQRPDVLLLNEFDYDAQREALAVFQEAYLQASDDQIAGDPIEYQYSWTDAVNTGEPSGLDFNRNGKTTDPNDAFGFGLFPGQYGMAVLSKRPLDFSGIRTFRKLLWDQMPNASQPLDPKTGQSWYPEEIWKQLRLSSKSHWDIPIAVNGTTIHLLACHPTPPAFDGPEDRNGRRNHDEIRLWADYLTAEHSTWIVDDQGRSGGLSQDARFVIAGDLNADPRDGGSFRGAINQLLDHARINGQVAPSSAGAVEASLRQGRANKQHQGNAAHDTADFSDGQVGNLRVDYVLPSKNLNVVGSGVFWPDEGESGFEFIDCSDHRMVWVDVRVSTSGDGN